MAEDSYLFTSEAVAEGHPDKVADQISDRILDQLIHTDFDVRAGIETMVTSNLVVLSGETSLKNFNEKINIDDIVRSCIKEIGYDQENFHWKKVEILNRIHGQSSDIAQGVDASINKPIGAGDQGIMFGYATDETENYMPASLYYANRILLKISGMRKSGLLNELGPDAKSQVTLLYKDGYPIKAKKILVSNQHSQEADNKTIRNLIKDIVVSTMPEGWMCNDDDFLVNPTGKFVIGGPDGDAGLTGRKIIVDTYGGAVPHGGGAFSGKDPTKVDRSAAYMARYIAKNIVHAKISSKCLIQISYAIGMPYPLSLNIKLDQNTKVEKAKLLNTINKIIDLSPGGIIKYLELNKPIYARTSCYGHFGRIPDSEGGFSWEKLDLSEKLISEL
ncbi:MAG: methionine adenosyltransferase [Alphaproteobacteria bacterium]|uniref:Methionine adenosyltransferase n=1 Tax=PS1 clade bacterium TaxID=2175152 RepID=A0A368DRM5_9PROT|nr:MAG: methionine adenosyltransferase [PS1 clade bacterium]|tara:strand:+ start:2728 stop:3894 length:1167 start_codon:yes stop_codon:yes gene_type:complete